MDTKYLIDAVKPIDAIHWKEHDLTIVQDGYLQDGTRVHVVRERLKSEPITLSNAIVVSENYLALCQINASTILNNVSCQIDLKKN